MVVPKRDTNEIQKGHEYMSCPCGMTYVKYNVKHNSVNQLII